jgi:hypothetical protein
VGPLVLDYALALKSAPRRIGAFGSVAAGLNLRLAPDSAGSCWHVAEAALFFSQQGQLVAIACQWSAGAGEQTFGLHYASSSNCNR